MNQCEKCGFTRRQVRLLPTSRGEGHGNMILCHFHFGIEIAWRHWMVDNKYWAEDAADFPTWEELSIYHGE